MREVQMTEEDKENVFELARLVRKMYRNLHSDIKGKQRLVNHLIDVANTHCDPVLKMLGYMELQHDTPMKCKQCAWRGSWGDGFKSEEKTVCPTCKGEIVLLEHE